MRIERVQHRGNRTFEKFVVIKVFAADVIVLNHRQSFSNVQTNFIGRNGFCRRGILKFVRSFRFRRVGSRRLCENARKKKGG